MHSYTLKSSECLFQATPLFGQIQVFVSDLLLQTIYDWLLLIGFDLMPRPLEVQFFSSATSAIVLLPTCLLSIDLGQQDFSASSMLLYLINGVSFHCQTLLALTLMSFISPVTHRFVSLLLVY
jgi:hypothetical protein